MGVQARMAPGAIVDRYRNRVCGRGGRGAFPVDGWRTELARTPRIARSWDRSQVAAGGGRNVSAHGDSRSERPEENLRCHLGRGRFPHRRWRGDVEADQSRAVLEVHSRSDGRGWPLRAPRGHESVAAGCTVHAEALGRDAQRRRGRFVAEVSGNLPTDFGFVIDVHAHEPETIYVVPIKSDSEHYVHEGKLRVYRSRTGGNEWEAMTQGSSTEGLLRERVARRHGRGLAR